MGGLSQADEVVPALLVRAAASVATVGHDPVVVVEAAHRLAELGVADVFWSDPQLVTDVTHGGTVNDDAWLEPLEDVLPYFRPASCHCFLPNC